MINCPCKDCPKKGCGAYHEECEAYQAFRAEKLKEYEERLKKYPTNYKFYKKNRRQRWKNENENEKTTYRHNICDDNIRANGGFEVRTVFTAIGDNMAYKSKRSRACDIPQKVKEKVWERDGEKCIICGNNYAMPNAHFISRAHGGIGIEENIVTLCQNCHHAYDNTPKRPIYREAIKTYLRGIYGAEWSEEKLTYKKF